MGSPPHKLPKMVRFLNLPYKEFISAGTTSILEFLAFWASLSFWLASGVRFPKLPYKEFNSAGTASILEFLVFLGLSSRLLLATSKERFLMRHKKKRYLSRKCGPPRSKSYCATRRNATKRGQFCHFCLFAGQLVGSPPQVAKNGPFSQAPIQRIYQRRDRLHFGIFSLFGAFISVAFGHLQGAILNAPQKETLLITEMRPSKEQIVLCDKKKCY